MNILAIIPARAGSKGIPCKNITPMAGKPLVAYSIETALASKHINRVIVSTDDEDIATVAREYGAEVPFLRPKDMAGDKSPIGQAFSHVLDGLKETEGYIHDILVALYPTHPLRSVSLIDSLIDRCREGFTPVCTVKQRPVNVSTIFVSGENGPRLADIPYECSGVMPYSKPQGYVHISSNAAYREYMHILDDPVSCVDIDYPEDLEVAETMVRLGLWKQEAA